jgi:phosphatidylserine decarboxylase
LKYVSLVALYIISFPFLSRIWGRITKIERPAGLIKKVISFYRKHYGIDMSLYKGDLEDYSSLASFFVRPLDPAVRPLKTDTDSFLSPSDGKISVLEKVEANIATQVKGITFRITELLRKELDFSDGYRLITIYLSPRDYHRYHVPIDSTAVSYIQTGWRLYPVNTFSVGTVNNLFIKNERVCVKFRCKYGEFFYVAVGATFVGSVKMDFYDNPVEGKWVTVDRKYRQNRELGMFEMGSTIVLAVPEKMVKEMKVKEGDTVQVGQPLFTLEKGSTQPEEE